MFMFSVSNGMKYIIPKIFYKNLIGITTATYICMIINFTKKLSNKDYLT